MTATPGNVPVAENSNAIALGLLGDEWNLTIIKAAIMSGVSRYKDFRDTLGIANSVLTVRLRRLTEAGVFTMRQYSEAPRRFEYVLTECGRELWQVKTPSPGNLRPRGLHRYELDVNPRGLR